jgi:hypothetical protein
VLRRVPSIEPLIALNAKDEAAGPIYIRLRHAAADADESARDGLTATEAPS